MAAGGADVIAARVTDVTAGHDGVCLETTAGRLRTGFVVGADGTNSQVRRRLARPFRRDQLSIATGYFVHGVTSQEILLELGIEWDEIAAGKESGAIL